MYSDRNLINRKNVKADVHEAYTQCKDFFMLEFEARVLAAALKILGMSSIDSTPVTFKIPQCIEGRSDYSIPGRMYMFKVAKAILDTIVCSDSKASEIINAALNEEEIQRINAQQQLTPDGRYKCRFPGCPSTFKHDGKRGKTMKTNMTLHLLFQTSFSMMPTCHQPNQVRKMIYTIITVV